MEPYGQTPEAGGELPRPGKVLYPERCALGASSAALSPCASAHGERVCWRESRGLDTTGRG
jgi:hypothetical protein